MSRSAVHYHPGNIMPSFDRVRFPLQRSVSIVLPSPTATLICDRAKETWGSFATTNAGASIVVYVRPMRIGMRGITASPLAAIHIAFARPSPDQATIHKFEWGGSGGGTEDDIKTFLRQTTGWLMSDHSSAQTA
ncbi:MAG: hypothetical protein EPO26_13170 [Chloroflexota bacterium]|nr:MAG: hypothetical protein EPO26_13170 [Chloroflexota bacterium]